MGRERTVLGTLIVLLLMLWAGFLVHRSPRFPGSLTGGILAVSGATLMVVFSMAYMAVKRIPGLKRRISTHISMGRLLTWHVHTSAIGAILALLHTGHRFESDLGVALTALMLITVLSGYVGRHLLAKVSVELRDKQQQLAKLELTYSQVAAEMRHTSEPGLLSTLSLSRLALRPAALTATQNGQALAFRAVQAAEAIAELEYSIRAHERFKRWSTRWVAIHLLTALLFYALLGLHIWSSIHFGLRWFG